MFFWRLSLSKGCSLRQARISEEIFSFIEQAKESDEHDDEVAAKMDQLLSKFFIDPTSNIMHQGPS
jgi:hypothetical protein